MGDLEQCTKEMMAWDNSAQRNNHEINDHIQQRNQKHDAQM